MKEDVFLLVMDVSSSILGIIPHVTMTVCITMNVW